MSGITQSDWDWWRKAWRVRFHAIRVADRWGVADCNDSRPGPEHIAALCRTQREARREAARLNRLRPNYRTVSGDWVRIAED